MGDKLKNILGDARHYQIVILAILLSLQLFWADFGPELNFVLVVLPLICFVQFVFYKIYRVNSWDLRSAFISGFSLCILMRSEEIYPYLIAVFIVVASKFLIRINDKHIFNPANIAIVVCLLLFPNDVWVSPGQWGADVLLALLLSCLALLVLSKSDRWDMAIFFLLSFAVLTFGRALWLGDPMDIPIHQMQNGALLIFAFFMVSDPKTIPDNRWGRLIFAIAVSLLAYTMIYEFRIREALFYALPIVCVLGVVIDRCLIGKEFKWSEK